MSSAAPAAYQFALSASAEQNNLIVLLPDRLLIGTIPANQIPELDRRMTRQEPPDTLLPPDVRAIPLSSITKAEINLRSADCALQVREGPGIQRLSLNLGDEAHATAICDALLERLGDADVSTRTESRLKATVTWLGLAALFLGASIVLYVGVVSGGIQRAPSILAFLINTFGAVSLLVIGGLLAALFVMAWLASVLKPGTIVTMTRPGD